ncbi:MAG: respiratory nitrate reductase subunit gamma [Firmicutes bacterium]|nr:respiratory nitrate reductase subunit gamma [Alicyclobacillaceae bacterium]MCL6496740.1 respiratory nitrate reductase subunit gamma [Bacillota bacterium]
MLASIFWGAVYPYLCLAVLLVGCLYRYAYRPLSWTSRSSQILESRWLKWGSPLFHWGILAVLAGHVLGLLVPVGMWQAVGITPALYHQGADLIGGLAGFVAWVGLDLLLLRRGIHPRLRRTSSLSDWVALGWLWLVVTSGDAITLWYNHTAGPFPYRHTVGPWFRSLFLLKPDPGLLGQLPWPFQVHLLLAFGLFAVTPFSRLVHLWSAPVAYPRRAPIQYRRRGALRPDAATAAASDLHRQPGGTRG